MNILQLIEDEVDEQENEIEEIQLKLEPHRDYIIEYFSTLIDLYIESNPLCFCDETYEECIYESTTAFMESFISDVLNVCDINTYYIETACHDYFEEAIHMYYLHIAPKRSYDTTFIRKKPSLSQIEEKINYLRSKPQPEQRTEEWYLFRHNVITASNAWKIFHSQSTLNQIIYEKCKDIDTNKYSRVNTESTLHWGQKYEPLSVMYYEDAYTCRVEDYGCIKHDEYTCLAASPDGIVTSQDSTRYGRMLEIKNIVNRDITGIPKKEYWIQMQLQMEVCNLNECDFLETRFIEYESKEAFEEDQETNETKYKTLDGKPKGKMLQFAKDGQPVYHYMPLSMERESYAEWEQSIWKEMEKENTEYIRTIYWKLEEISCILVLRNKYWFQSAVPEIIETWKIIEKERVEGYEHRAPKRRVKQTPLVESKCMIKLSKPDENMSLLNEETNEEKIISKCKYDEMIQIPMKIHTESFDDTIPSF